MHATLLTIALAWAAVTTLRLRKVRVYRIVDGDSIELRRQPHGTIERVRIVGIDAPELLYQPHGQEARNALAEVLGKAEAQGRLRCIRRGRDCYGRTLASLYCGPVPVSVWMVWHGHAWPADSNMLRTLAFAARVRRAGLWHEPSPITPDLWRRLFS